MSSQGEKPLIWLGSSKKDLLSLPKDVQRFFGFALDFAQHGEKHDDAKVLKGFGGAGVLEVVENDVGGTYRAVYTVKFEEAIFVLMRSRRRVNRGLLHQKKTWKLSETDLRWLL